MSVITYQLTHKKIQAQLARLGDLPVFSATLNRIRELSSSEDSDAMMLAMAVMKDANLSARLLRVANTPSLIVVRVRLPRYPERWFCWGLSVLKTYRFR